MRAEREHSGWSQAALAEFLHLTQSTVSKLENDLIDPHARTVKIMAALFHVTGGYLIDGDPPP